MGNLIPQSNSFQTRSQQSKIGYKAIKHKLPIFSQLKYSNEVFNMYLTNNNDKIILISD